MESKKISKWTLTAMVVGSMVGAGIFALPQRFGAATGVFGSFAAWFVAGLGMYMLVKIFQSLAERRPELNAGVFSYAKAGFGDYAGFLSALGYWVGTCLGNVTYFVLIKSTLGLFFPETFGEGNTPIAIAISSVILWLFNYMILQGIKEATYINKIVTVAKVIPIIAFIIIIIFHFDRKIFMENFWGNGLDGFDFGGVMVQIRTIMLATVFVFLGVEGASVYSRYAQTRKHVSFATLFGFLSVLLLMVLVTTFSYGVLSQDELAKLQNPSMAGVFEAVLGKPGAIFISVGLMISVLGAYLSWMLLAAEVLFNAAKTDTMPKFLKSENAKGVPNKALILSSVVVQIFLILSYFSRSAFNVALDMTGAMTLIPYFFVAAYGLKLILTKDIRPDELRYKPQNYVYAIIATVYTIYLVYAGGKKYLLLTMLLYAIGTILFYIARKEQHKKIFNKAETILFVILIIGSLITIYLLSTGQISI